MARRWEQYNFEKSVKKVFSNPQGEELLEFMMDAFVNRRCWVQGQPDTTAFSEGEKNLVLTLKQLLEKETEQ